jgi:hypothetical protein
MNKLFVFTVLFLVLLYPTLSFSGDCVTVYGHSPGEAFAAAAQLVEEREGKDCVNSATRVRLLKEKENGLYVAEVSLGGACGKSRK